jgi:hypothetical protein
MENEYVLFLNNKIHALREKNKITTKEASNKQEEKESRCRNA